jgi:predicted deacetylase
VAGRLADAVVPAARRSSTQRGRALAVPPGCAPAGERYDGKPSEFAMRPWTEAELRAHAAAAGFASVDVRLEGDRLFVLARSSG